MKYITLTHEEHLKLADDLACAEHYLMKVAKKVEGNYPIQASIQQIRTLCTILEGAYVAVSSIQELEEHGYFPYSNLEARYNKLVNDVNTF